ncbi:MAG TPA: DEAD/DEAH box helicase family protein [Candidatus Ornithospirochaeta avicola]|uniref:DNA 3'-5' helicase n=1 Tax=Candidatus Ornithospirochaeta avicola TaxID=2840896 RepID=A0A9D1PV23_9SPIO|nr:DEAD/DEAH box helicase family protein [Candidatus Ornithospirochaeta avicola]
MEIDEALEFFKIRYLMPYQEMVIRNIIEAFDKNERNNLITVLPTGAGKSLCFMLPSFITKHYSIVIYPLNALISDQERRYKEASMPVSVINGSLKREEKDKELERLKKKESRILLTNIESLLSMYMRDDILFMKGETELFVLDEAHTIVTWGESFRTKLKEVKTIISYIKPHQVLSFTATLDKERKEKLQNLIYDNKASYLHASSDRKNIYYHSIFTDSKKADMEEIIKDRDMRPALIFCSSRKECKELYLAFSSSYECWYYHAGLDKENKTRIEKEFFNSENGILFSTNAYGMGVDKKNIRCVIHMKAPEDALSFLQESGRAGRDGKLSHSFVLASPEDGGISSAFTSSGCIRRKLLLLMGEERNSNCLLCDKCNKIKRLSIIDSTLLHFVKKRKFLYSKDSLIFNAKLGRLKRCEYEEIENALNRLLKEGSIRSFFSRLY